MNYSKILLMPVLLLLGAVLFISCYPQVKAEENANMEAIANSTLNWHSIDQLENLQKDGSKKVLVDIYTDWCKWCKVMDQKTFSDPAIIPYLNENFHLVKFNAETKTPLKYKGKSYDFVQGSRRGHHQLAAELSKGKLSYPSFVVLDENLQRLDIIKGFKDATAFKRSLDQITK